MLDKSVDTGESVDIVLPICKTTRLVRTRFKDYTRCFDFGLNKNGFIGNVNL